MKIILYTGIHCPKCPTVRKNLREACSELGLVEGKDFIEKIIDCQETGEKDIEGTKYYLVADESLIKNIPAAVVGEDVILEALTHQVASVPSIVINGEPVFIGDTPGKEELKKKIQEYLG
ncbi:MAG: thioredoxin family protein [archaeon]